MIYAHNEKQRKKKHNVYGNIQEKAILIVDKPKICGERKWGNGWHNVIKERYYCYMEEYSIYIGTATMLYCRMAKNSNNNDIWNSYGIGCQNYASLVEEPRQPECFGRNVLALP